MNIFKSLATKFTALSTAGKVGVAVATAVSVTAVGGGTYLAVEQIAEQNKIKEEEKKKEGILDSYNIKDNLVFEFGEIIELEPETFVTVKNKAEYEKMTITTAPTYEEGKEYLAVGKYDGKVEYKKTEKEFSYEVKDTTAPKFTTFKESVELYASTEHTLEGLKTNFVAEDLSGTPEIEINGTYDLAKVGTYDIKVSAKDKHGNITSEGAKITVKEKPKAPTSSGGSISSSGGSSSSDDKIIVDSGGKTPGYDANGNGQIDRPDRVEDNSSSDNVSSKVCVPGEPDPSQIGNSGLLFYGNDAYYAWQNEFLQSDEYYAIEGFSSWPIANDCMGNNILDKEIWTVEWW